MLRCKNLLRSGIDNLAGKHLVFSVEWARVVLQQESARRRYWRTDNSSGNRSGAKPGHLETQRRVIILHFLIFCKRRRLDAEGISLTYFASPMRKLAHVCKDWHRGLRGINILYGD
jgi:hypothetical protein